MIMHNSCFMRCMAYGVVFCVVLLMAVIVFWQNTTTTVIDIGIVPVDRLHRVGQYPALNASPPLVAASTLTETPPPYRLLCHGFAGRLGNQMFQVASILGMAWTMDRLPVFLKMFHLNTVLKRSLCWPNQTQLEAACEYAVYVEEKNCYAYDPSLVMLNPYTDYTVGAYLQSWKYFEKHKARVIEALTFNDVVAEKAAELTNVFRIRHGKAVLVGFHVRRGDMGNKMHQERGYPLASAGYLNRSMTYFKQRFPDCVFVLSSDDIMWCKRNVQPGFKVDFLNMSSPEVDMSVMVSMDHVILTFGSYSWWIGYLNKGITVYMKNFIRNGTHLGNSFTKPEDYIYPGWVPI